MIDYLEEAAARAVELSGELIGPRSDVTAPIAAAHLTYLAGLIRGGAPTVVTVEEPPLDDVVQTWERMKLRRTAADEAGARLYAEEGQRRAERQRDELLRAARKAVPVNGRADRELNELYDVIERVEREIAAP